MKTRVWLLAIPLILLGAIWLAKEVAWRKEEAHFRVALRDWTNQCENVVVSVEPSNGHPDLDGNWNKPEFFAAIQEMELRRPATKFVHQSPMISISLNDGTSVGEPFGVFLPLTSDRGWVILPTEGEPLIYELSPESCRDLKKRIFALKEDDGDLFTPRSKSKIKTPREIVSRGVFV